MCVYLCVCRWGNGIHLCVCSYECVLTYHVCLGDGMCVYLGAYVVCVWMCVNVGTRMCVCECVCVYERGKCEYICDVSVFMGTRVDLGKCTVRVNTTVCACTDMCICV